MLAVALEAEVDAYVEATRASSTTMATVWWCATGMPARTVTTGGGRDRGPGAAGERPAGRSRDRGEVRFKCSIVPPWCRRSRR